MTALQEAQAAIADVQDRLSAAEARIDAQDKAIAVLRKRTGQIDDVAEHLMTRADEIGADVVKARREQRRNRQVDPDAPAGTTTQQRLMPRVATVRIGNRTVRRAVVPH